MVLSLGIPSNWNSGQSLNRKSDTSIRTVLRNRINPLVEFGIQFGHHLMIIQRSIKQPRWFIDWVLSIKVMRKVKNWKKNYILLYAVLRLRFPSTLWKWWRRRPGRVFLAVVWMSFRCQLLPSTRHHSPLANQDHTWYCLSKGNAVSGTDLLFGICGTRSPKDRTHDGVETD
jgi:hypothetical protein